jgi:hypothetical protein
MHLPGSMRGSNVSFLRREVRPVADRVKIPRDLGNPGRALWKQVVKDAAENNLELTAQEEFWLHSACELTDQAAEIKAALEGRELYMKGSQGQDVSKLLLGELRQFHLAISLTLGRIKTDAPAESSLGVPVPRSVASRNAANARWRRG